MAKKTPESTVRAAVRGAAAGPLKHRSQTPRLDAELLLADVLGTTRERLYAQPERVLTAAEREAFDEAVRRRSRREPVAYILGRKAFRTIELELNEDTLIPRPETETLVDVVLAELARLRKPEPRVLDVGTGSGNIALAIAAEHDRARVVATEVHPAPLEMARKNAARLQLEDRVEFVVSDVYDGLPGGARFDVIVCNPPYVTDQAFRRLSIDVRGYEPWVALRGGPHGMNFYERIIPGAPQFLEPRGLLVVEIPETRVVEVISLFVAVGRFEEIDVHNDLGGAPRAVSGREKA